MSHIQNVSIDTQDTKALDAFGRFRVSQAFNTFDIQFTYDKMPLFFEEILTGNGTVTHQPNVSGVRLSTGGTAQNDQAMFHGKRYFRYQPGRSNQVVFTCIMGAKKANVTKQIGIYDLDNGLFFEQDGSNLKIVRRTKTSGSVVDNVVNQSSWNIDILDGTGNSGKTLDETKDNIYVIDYQWLGAGRIRFGFDFGGQISYAHEIIFANTEAVPFMSTGNLPFMVNIKNTATAASSTNFDFTCLSIQSEGGFNPLGIPVSTQNTVLRDVTAANDPLPIISIRPRTTFNSITNRALSILKSFSVMSEDASIRYEIILNGSLTGASFANVNTTNSTMQVDVASTAITGGLVIASGFLTGAKDKKESGVINEEIMSKLILSNDRVGTTSDILSLVISIINSSDTASDCGGSFSWKELR